MRSTQYVVEIQDWDWPLHVGIRPRLSIEERDPEGDLLCVRAITIEAIVVAPERHRSKPMLVGMAPLPRDIIVGDGEDRLVGRLRRHPDEQEGPGFYAHLFLPDDTLQSTLLCLSSKWRSIYMWVDEVDEHAEPGSITDFGFSARGA